MIHLSVNPHDAEVDHDPWLFYHLPARRQGRLPRPHRLTPRASAAGSTRPSATAPNSSPRPSPRATPSRTPAPPPSPACACAASSARPPATPSPSAPPSSCPTWPAWTDDAEEPLFLRRFGVPFWALARVFGKDPMYWYRLEVGLGRNSVVGTTVRRADLPEHLLADEHHQTRDGEKIYVATTVAEGCCLGAAVVETADADGLTDGLRASSRQEAQDVEPDYAAQDGQHRRLGGDPPGLAGAVPAGGAAALLPARLAEHPRPGQASARRSTAVGGRCGTPTRPRTGGASAQRLRRLREWAGSRRWRRGCWSRCRSCAAGAEEYGQAYDHPGGHRTSNMLDRVMRAMNRYFDERPAPARLGGGGRAARAGVGVAAQLPRRGARRRRGPTTAGGARRSG